MKLENPGQLFLKSLDNEDETQVYEKVQVKTELTVRVKLITEMFEDGSPSLKHFSSYFNPKETKYTFRVGQVVDLVDNHYNSETYWFDNGIWFMCEISTEDVIEMLEQEEWGINFPQVFKKNFTKTVYKARSLWYNEYIR